MSAAPSSFLNRSSRRPIELDPSDVCFDHPLWLKATVAEVKGPRAAEIAPYRPPVQEADESTLSPLSTGQASPPPKAMTSMQETIQRAVELTADLRRAASAAPPAKPALKPAASQRVTSPSPPPADPAAPGPYAAPSAAQLQQLVLQHQRRIDQLDDALRSERAARLQLEAVVAAMRAVTVTSSTEPQQPCMPAGVPGKPQALLSPQVKSPPGMYHPSAALRGGELFGHVRTASDAGSVTELRAVWGEVHNEVPANP